MAKKQDLIDGFESRIKDTVRNDKKPAPRNASGRPADKPVSAQELERRSRVGRKSAGSTESRLGDARTYTSLRINAEQYEKLREIARRNGLPYCDLIDAAIRKFVEQYEAKHGQVEVSRESHISAESLI